MQRLEKGKNSLKCFFEKNVWHMVAFLIPVIIMLLVYYIRGVYPFGDQIYLRSDCYHQYAPFHMELLRKLQNGESLLYSWDIGMGVNFISTIAYYLASPFNLLLLFVPASSMTEMVGVFIIFKIGLCGLTTSVYLGYRVHKTTPATAAFALFYALSSYLAAFNWNIMWLDCLWLFPLIVMGLERLVKERKCVMYCVTLGLAIISNYYIGIMICIFCVIYFIALLFTQKKEVTVKSCLGDFLRFGGYSLLAGGMAAFLILPEYFTLLLSASADSSFPDTLTRYFSILDMLSRSLIEVDTAVFSAHDPNLYCTVGVFLFIPLYLICKKIPLKERVVSAILIGIMLLSFNLNIPNYIWHGLHFPNSLPARESFIYIFLLVGMCFEAFMHIRDFTRKQICACLFGAGVVLILIEQLYVSSEYNFMIVYLSAAFILLYFVICIYLRNPKYVTSVLMKLMILVAACEAFINTEATSLESTTLRDNYLSDNDNIENLLEVAEESSDTLFYRVEKEVRRTKNDAAWIGYHGVSIFSSMTNSGISEFLQEMGMEYSYNAYSYYGHTPLTESLLSVKYVLSSKELEETATMVYLAEDDGYYIYENLYTLPLGFMVSEQALDETMLETDNPFYSQNLFCGYACGDYNLFTSLTTESYATSVKAINDREETIDAYFYIYNGCESVSVAIYDAEGTYISSLTFSDLDDGGRICHVGSVEPGGYFTVTSSDTEHSSVSLYAVAFEDDVYLKMYETLVNEGLVISEFEDTYICGEVTALEDGYMYTSIPYEEGWTVTVDGVEVETEEFQGAFLTFQVSAGTHTIEFSYYPKGLAVGIGISVICVLILVSSSVGIVLLRGRRSRIAHQKAMDEIVSIADEVTSEIRTEETSESREKDADIPQNPASDPARGFGDTGSAVPDPVWAPGDTGSAVSDPVRAPGDTGSAVSDPVRRPGNTEPAAADLEEENGMIQNAGEVQKAQGTDPKPQAGRYGAEQEENPMQSDVFELGDRPRGDFRWEDE